MKSSNNESDNNGSDNNGTDISIMIDSSNIMNNSICHSRKEINKKWSTLKQNYPQFFHMKWSLVLIIIFSLSGFCWHLIDSISEYRTYKTKVTFAAEEPKDYKFSYPGVTLCYKDLAPFDKLKKLYPKFAEDVERIQKEMIVRNNTNFFSEDESANFTSPKLMGNQLQSHYENQLMTNLSILDILQNWSFGEPAKCTLFSFPIVQNRDGIVNCTQITPVLESINGDVRCFTYFSQFFKSNKSEDLFTITIFKDDEERENKIAFIGFDKNDPNFRSNPFDAQFRARIAIHPSNMIPDPENYPNKVLYEWKRFYSVMYWKTVSYLLEPPYETNCRFYNIRDENDLQSYHDCFAKCIIQKYRDKCKCLPKSGLLYSKNLINSNDKFCQKDNKCKPLNARSSCAKDCNPDCISEQYEFETWADIPWHNFPNTTGVSVYRKPVLDQVYTHSPGITWIQLVSDFGGLGGMWLGISAISISKAIICWLNKSFSKNKIQERSN